MACETLCRNLTPTGTTLEGSVHQVDVRVVRWRAHRDPVRLLAGGSPCQPFSLAGKHLGHDDSRNLFPEVLRAVRELRPAAVFLENVRGLLSGDPESYFAYILRQLECPVVEPYAGEYWANHDRRIRRHQQSSAYRATYNVAWRMLNAADYGIPQIRARLFIVAVRAGGATYTFPPATHSKTTLLGEQLAGGYWIRHGLPAPLSTPRIPGTSGAYPGADECASWVTVRDGLSGLWKPAACESDARANHWVIPGARSYHGHSGSRMDWPSKTVKAGVNGVPGGENCVIGDDDRIRYYTLREAARMQSFPDTHLFMGSRSNVTGQIGNAVPPDLAAAVARPLRQALQATDNATWEAMRDEPCER